MSDFVKQPINAKPRSFIEMMEERLNRDLDLRLITIGASAFLPKTYKEIAIQFGAEPVAYRCTCGAASINCASHSHWCDSNRGGTTR